MEQKEPGSPVIPVKKGNKADRTALERVGRLCWGFPDVCNTHFCVDIYIVLKCHNKCNVDISDSKTRSVNSNDQLPVLNDLLYPVLTQNQQEKVLNNTWHSVVLKCDNMGGRGVFATQTIQRGAIICHYGGELTNKVKGEEDMSKGHTKFLMQITVGDTKLFFNHNETTRATYGSMLNHSRLHPNCVKNVYQDKNGLPVIIFKANRLIKPDEELLHDYGPKYGLLPACSKNCHLCMSKHVKKEEEEVDDDMPGSQKTPVGKGV